MSAINRKRRRSFNEPGHAHFLTYSCQDRLPLLNSDRTRQWVIDALAVTRERHRFDLLGDVIMPEHVHLLIFPRDLTYRMDRILSDLKRPVSWKAKQHLVETGRDDWLRRLTVKKAGNCAFRFWLSGGGFDRNITTEKSIPKIIRYMHDNPVRRGLVDSASPWIWSSARYYEGIRPVPIEMDPLS